MPTPPSLLRRTAGWLAPLGALACLLLPLPPAVALLGGMALGLGSIAHPLAARAAPALLQAAVIALGAGVNLAAVARAGLDGLGVTLLSIVATLLFGHWLGRRLGVSPAVTLLVSGGTAICGGSAIAALAGATKPREPDVALSLAIVFLLNAVALVLLPPLGRACGLTDRQFGWWAALAIHDTSAVVGAGLAFSATALALATTIKLARALWIVPVTLWAARTVAPTGQARTPWAQFPWFILGFLALAGARSAFPALQPLAAPLADLAPRLLVVALFLIGTGFTRATLGTVGWRPLALGVILWLTVAVTSLGCIRFGLAGT